MRPSLVAAFAQRENVFRLTFSAPMAFTGLLDATDASNPARYSVAPVAGTVGADGNAPRPLLAVLPLQVPGDALSVDLTVDRPMSPYPAQYLLGANGIADTSGNVLLPGTSFVAFGTYQPLPPPQLDKAVPSPDLAHPDSLAALLDPIPFGNKPVLGGMPAGGDGDYAVDDGDMNLKKRCFRRVMTVKGKFAHLPGYGASLPTFLKRLSSVAGRQAMAAEAEAQVGQEPDVVRCRVTVEVPDDAPALGRFILLVRSAHNGDAKFTFPFSQL